MFGLRKITVGTTGPDDEALATSKTRTSFSPAPISGAAIREPSGDQAGSRKVPAPAEASREMCPAGSITVSTSLSRITTEPLPASGRASVGTGVGRALGTAGEGAAVALRSTRDATGVEDAIGVGAGPVDPHPASSHDATTATSDPVNRPIDRRYA